MVMQAQAFSCAMAKQRALPSQWGQHSFRWLFLNLCCMVLAAASAAPDTCFVSRSADWSLDISLLSR